jgi:hypothetical protein
MQAQFDNVRTAQSKNLLFVHVQEEKHGHVHSGEGVGTVDAAPWYLDAAAVMRHDVYSL